MKVGLEAITPEDFEFLCEDLLRAKNFTIESRPARGPDAGKDMLAVRDVTDDMGLVHRERWLVECKHIASSNRSVTEKDVGNIELRMKRHHANRYLLISSGTVGETVKSQLEALSRDETSARMAAFWVKSDLVRLLSEYPDVQRRYFATWEDEAKEAAILFHTHYFVAHGGAVLWRRGITALFGNDGYASIGDDSSGGAERAHREVDLIRERIRERNIEELAFATTPDGYTWVMLVKTEDAPTWDELIWSCYPLGGSNNRYTRHEAKGLLWQFMKNPVKQD
jgi:hypothetical protein